MSAKDELDRGLGDLYHKAFLLGDHDLALVLAAARDRESFCKHPRVTAAARGVLGVPKGTQADEGKRLVSILDGVVNDNAGRAMLGREEWERAASRAARSLGPAIMHRPELRQWLPELPVIGHPAFGQALGVVEVTLAKVFEAELRTKQEAAAATLEEMLRVGLDKLGCKRSANFFRE